MQFVDVKNDVAFRKIFGNENRKEVLISFLNAVLMLENDKKIVSVDILTPYQFPALKGGRVTIVDLRAKDQNNKHYLIEMQVAEVNGLDKRVLYYASRSYSSQIERGDLYEELNPTFFIGILDFEATRNKEYLSRHKIMDVDTGENFIKDIEFNFIELPKFNKKSAELTSIIDQWVYFIKNAEGLEIIPENVTDEGLKTAYTDAAKHNWTKKELEEYDNMFIREQDERGKFSLALKREKEEMAKEFRREKEETAKEFKQKEEETAKEFRRKEEKTAKEFRRKEKEMGEKAKREKEEMAKEFRREKEETSEKLLNMGVSIENTAKATGLTVKEVKKLKDKE